MIEPLPDDPLPEWPAEDRAALARFLRIAPGHGFQMAAVEVPGPAARARLLRQLGAAHPGLELREVSVAGAEDPLGAMRRGWSPDPRRVSVLVGLDDGDDEALVGLWRALNVQRDRIVQEVAGTWLLTITAAMSPRMVVVAPDFCDFVSFWARTRPPEARADAWQGHEAAERVAPAVRSVERAGSFAVALPGPPVRLVDVKRAVYERRRVEALGRFELAGLLAATLPELPAPLVKVEQAVYDGRLPEAEEALDRFELAGGEPRAVARLLRAMLLERRGDRGAAERELQAASGYPALSAVVRSRWLEAAGDLPGAAGALDVVDGGDPAMAFVIEVQRACVAARRGG
ncbi:MAG TPA: hypothetical protein PKA64_18540, partial [Myxococcota bacterium]|nr:hypothetical protein [Myxococcota bacterium]